MKFFQEIRSCCGGATSTPAAEAADTPLEQEPLFVGTSKSPSPAGRRRLRKLMSATNWKPALSAISEDGVVLKGSDSQRAVGSKKKVPVEAKSTARIRSPKYTDGYWKSKGAMVLPAFAPTPYLF